MYRKSGSSELRTNVFFLVLSGHAIRVLAIDTGAVDTINIPRPFIIPFLDAAENFVAIHHVRFQVNHRHLIKPGREQIAEVDVIAPRNLRHVLGRILVGR